MHPPTKKLGEVAIVGSGNSAPQKESLFENGIFPFFRTSDVGQVHIGMIDRAEDLLNEKGIRGLKPFSRGTILFPKSGASTFLNHRVMLGTEGYVSSHLATIVADEKVLDRKFLFYFLTLVDAKELVQDSKYPSLKVTDIAAIDIPLPPLPEQKHIVKILDEIFEKIAKAKQNTEKNLQNSSELFESYLQSVFANPREEWEMKRLGDVCDTGAGGTPLKSHKDYYEGGNIPWLRSGEVDRKDILKSELHITEKGLKNSSARLFPKNTVLVAMYGATAGQVGILRFESTTNQAVCGILPNKDFLPEYLYYVFSAGKVALVKQAVGGAQPNISQIKIKDTLIPNLKLSQQSAIVSKLDSLSAETKKLEAIYKQKLADMDELKKSVLKQAFSGKL